MLITEQFQIREDGIVLMKTHSDLGRMLRRQDGELFSEAIDVEGSGNSYTETEQPIPAVPVYPAAGDATEADYQAALSEFGVML